MAWGTLWHAGADAIDHQRRGPEHTAIMLHGSDNPTLVRDTLYSVVMIVLGAMPLWLTAIEEAVTAMPFIAGEGAAVTQTAGLYDSATNYVLPTTASGAGLIRERGLALRGCRQGLVAGEGATITGNPTKTYDASASAIWQRPAFFWARRTQFFQFGDYEKIVRRHRLFFRAVGAFAPVPDGLPLSPILYIFSQRQIGHQRNRWIRSDANQRKLQKNIGFTQRQGMWSDWEMVDRAGFEPAYACTGRFTVCCL
jgi:hypothetical protein